MFEVIKIAQKKNINFYAQQTWILVVLGLLIGGVVGYVISGALVSKETATGESIWTELQKLAQCETACRNAYKTCKEGCKTPECLVKCHETLDSCMDDCSYGPK